MSFSAVLPCPSKRFLQKARLMYKPVAAICAPCRFACFGKEELFKRQESTEAARLMYKPITAICVPCRFACFGKAELFKRQESAEAARLRRKSKRSIFLPEHSTFRHMFRCLQAAGYGFRFRQYCRFQAELFCLRPLWWKDGAKSG